MKFDKLKKILLRLFNSYIKKHLNKLMLSLLLSLFVAGSTGAIAWLLDPAIKKIFIDQDQTMILLIPVAIALSFSIKGGSLYAARSILIMFFTMNINKYLLLLTAPFIFTFINQLKIFEISKPESCVCAFKNNNLTGLLIFIFIFSFNIL